MTGRRVSRRSGRASWRTRRRNHSGTPYTGPGRAAAIWMQPPTIACARRWKRMIQKRRVWRTKSSSDGSSRQLVLRATARLARAARPVQITEDRRANGDADRKKGSRCRREPFFFSCPRPLPRRWHVVACRQILVPLYEQVLARLIVVLAASHEDMLDARGELERIPAPDDDVSFATDLE